jgi:hypothetical protein
MTIMVKEVDLAEAEEQRAKKAAHERAPSTEDLDAFNELLGQLGIKPVKCRQCVDYSAEGMLNRYLIEIRFRYPEIDDLLSILNKGEFLGKLDISRCFNNIPLHPSQYHLLGIEYEKVIFQVRFIMFGISLGPLICSILTAEMARGFIAEDIPTRPYLDDNAITGPTETTTRQRMDRAERRMTQLGWPVNVDKREGPARRLPYRGIVFDTEALTLSIEAARCRRLVTKVDAVLLIGADPLPRRVDRWQSLLGKLEWIASVLPPARLYLQPLWASIPYRRGRPCKYWSVKVSPAARACLLWWRRFLCSAAFNSTSWSAYWPQAPERWHRIFSDSAGSEGFGAVAGSEVIIGRWSAVGAMTSAEGGMSSSWKEYVPVLLALDRLAASLSPGSVVVITTDNQGNAFAINKGKTNPTNRPVFEAILIIAFHHRIYVLADWIPREYNVLCDNLSKLPYPSSLRLAPLRPRRPGDALVERLRGLPSSLLPPAGPTSRPPPGVSPGHHA